MPGLASKTHVRTPGMNLRPTLIVALTARVLLVTACAAGFTPSQSEPAGVQDDTRIVADFGSRVEKYLDLRKKAGDSRNPRRNLRNWLSPGSKQRTRL
jgi:hypothetical protein